MSDTPTDRMALAAEAQHRIYAWLGYWRDSMPAEAVIQLQDLLGPLAASPLQAVGAAEPVGEMLESSIYPGLIIPVVEPELPIGTKLYAHPQPAPAGDAGALADMEARKDAAYLERNRVVAALAKCFPSGIARTAIEGWSEDWHGCVYIDLPTGQVSWHFHDSQAYLFDGLPAYTKPWDGHSTEEKYRRLAALSAQPEQAAEKVVARWSRTGTNIYDRAAPQDVLIRIDGDWDSDEQREQYAAMVLARLNASPTTHPTPGTDGAGMSEGGGA